MAVAVDGWRHGVGGRGVVHTVWPRKQRYRGRLLIFSQADSSRWIHLVV